jgi:hypothetical protein
MQVGYCQIARIVNARMVKTFSYFPAKIKHTAVVLATNGDTQKPLIGVFTLCPIYLF